MGNTWKIVLATAVIFAAGAVTGGLLVQHVLGGRVAPPARVPAGPPSSGQAGPREVPIRDPNVLRAPPEQQRLEFVLRATRDLRLDSDQRERIERLMREGQERTQEYWERSQPELRRLLQETREKIRAELTLEQRERFEELLRQPRPSRGQEAPGAAVRTPGEIRRPLAPGSNQPARPLRQPPGGRPSEPGSEATPPPR